MKKYLLALVAAVMLMVGFTSCGMIGKHKFYLENDVSVDITDWAVFEWYSYASGDAIMYHNDKNDRVFPVYAGETSDPIKVDSDEEVFPVWMFKGYPSQIFGPVDEDGVYHTIIMETDILYSIYLSCYYEHKRSAEGTEPAISDIVMKDSAGNEYKIVQVGEVDNKGKWILY